MRKVAPWLVALAAVICCLLMGFHEIVTVRMIERIKAADNTQAQLLSETRSRLSELNQKYAVVAADLKAARAKAPAGDGTDDSLNSKREVMHMHDLIHAHPEMAEIFRKDIRRNVMRQYGDILGAMNLPPEQVDKLKDLLVEQTFGAIDAHEAAVQMGIKPDTPEMQQALGQARNDVNKEIKALVGPDAAAILVGNAAYTVQQASSDMRDAGVALTPEQLVALAHVASDASSSQKNPSARGPNAYQPDPATSLTPVQQTMLQNAAEVLSPAQLQILKSNWMQQNQEQAIMKEASGGKSNWSLYWD